MKVTYTCHNVTHSEIAKEGDFGGQKVVAKVPVVEVELTSDDKSHGRQTYRFWGKDAEVAAELFKRDGRYKCEWSENVPPPPPMTA